MTDLPADILALYNELAQQEKCDKVPDPLTRDAHPLGVPQGGLDRQVATCLLCFA
jgi:hypothetical protein